MTKTYAQLVWGSRRLHIVDGGRTLCGKVPPQEVYSIRRPADMYICSACRKVEKELSR